MEHIRKNNTFLEIKHITKKKQQQKHTKEKENTFLVTRGTTLRLFDSSPRSDPTVLQAVEEHHGPRYCLRAAVAHILEDR